MLDIKEYPTDFMMRNNQYAPLYCDIALEAYFEARQIYNTMKDAKWLMADPRIDFRMPDKVHKKVATAVVFSAMAAEAFINDYLAIRLGDKVFYAVHNTSSVHYYDKLDRIMTILLQPHHKEQQWYKDIRDLFNLRNEFVHSSSREVSVGDFIEMIYPDEESRERARERLAAIPPEGANSQSEKFHAVLNQEELDESWEIKNPRVADSNERQQLRQGLENAKFALKALCDMTRVIEKADPKSRAFTRTFNQDALEWGEDDEKAVRIAVFPELGLPLKNNYK